MDLGKVRLLRAGLNALRQALHPVHGLAWTDGRRVILTALSVRRGGEPALGDSSVVGKFAHVHGLSWGPPGAADTPALLTVQHKKRVTVWELGFSPDERNGLLASQTCEMREPLPVLPQGCVWHPKKEILTVLTHRDASVIHSVRCDGIVVKADVKASGLIHCGCWTEEGDRLVLAVGSALHSYVWDNARKTLLPCSFCPIFDVGGYICATEATVGLQIAAATGRPLEKSCGLHAGLAFDRTTSSEIASLVRRPTLGLMDEDYDVDFGKKATESRKSLFTETPSLGSRDLARILAKHRRSDPSPLISLRSKDKPPDAGQGSSSLILVTFERKVTTTRKVRIPGIPVPDIIAFDAPTQTVAVASNACDTITVRSIAASSGPSVRRIQLEKDERPKGACFSTDKLLLILVGKSTDSASPPASNSETYLARLMFQEALLGEEPPSGPRGPQNVRFGCDPSVDVPGRRRFSENPSRGEPLVNWELLLRTGDPLARSPSTKRRITHEAGSPGYEKRPGRGSSGAGDTLEAVSLGRSPSLVGLGTGFPSRPASPKLASGVTHETADPPKHDGCLGARRGGHFVRSLESLCGNLRELQHRLSELTALARDGMRPPHIYPSVREPSFVNITFQKPFAADETGEEKRTVLLCDGKLHLKTAQEAFNLSVIEMKHDSSWIILTADIDGFVPLTFKAAQEIIIRDGRVSEESCQSRSGKNTDISSSATLPSGMT
ncbi:WD repeat and coiled-coil-containing protein-like [Tachyglossus aculeatus]|uniref:WD repeat and coiled-coil-containing protein-like n=1 Tax=Tachyglossus aculeatus TaxID=9261 RepID=UPI0018F761E6|nr:WD repeat and coiled-coil-containing protein-like [Tachyglossus aculeatus]